MFGMGTGEPLRHRHRKPHFTMGDYFTMAKERKTSFLDNRREDNKGQAARSISTGQLNGLLHVHFQPINVVVYHGPLGGLLPGRPYLGVGFPLRCFQRLSRPDIATRHCHGHDNRNTGGPSIPVLSY